MFEVFKKEPDTETNKTVSISNEQEIPQEHETRQTTDLPDWPHMAQEPDAVDDLDLLPSFQIMKTEEQDLLNLKQKLLTRQRDLQSKLVAEMDKKKMTMNDLKSEIPSLQNKCQELAQALGLPSTTVKV